MTWLFAGGRWWIRTTEVERQQIYSLPPLAAREHSHIEFWSWWTDLNPRPADYKSAALPAELHQRFCRFSRVLVYNNTSFLKCQHFFKIFFKIFSKVFQRHCEGWKAMMVRAYCFPLEGLPWTQERRYLRGQAP